MKLTEQNVAQVAALASLDLTPGERERMLRDLNRILEYIDQLNEVDTSSVPPMAQAGELQQKSSALRDDETRPSLPHEEAMRNAPQTDGVYFQVPKVIER
jgi:aspartyl-tRNA(Asn)/glutamyl-tRNA(Gln) amidotransferase subunit C